MEWVPYIVAANLALIGYLVAGWVRASAVSSTQRETIAAQQRQIDRLEITALVQDKFMQQLPGPRSTPGDKV